MIIRQISFNLDASLRSEFEAFWKTKYLVAMTKQKGFVAARLLEQAEDNTCLQIQIEFDSGQDAAAWRKSNDHECLKPDFKRFVPTSKLIVYMPIG